MSLGIASDGLLKRATPLSIATRGLLYAAVDAELLEFGTLGLNPYPQIPRDEDDEDVMFVIASLFRAHRRVGRSDAFDDTANTNERNRK